MLTVAAFDAQRCRQAGVVRRPASCPGASRSSAWWCASNRLFSCGRCLSPRCRPPQRKRDRSADAVDLARTRAAVRRLVDHPSAESRHCTVPQRRSAQNGSDRVRPTDDLSDGRRGQAGSRALAQMMTMQPVGEVYARDGFALWPIAEVESHSCIALSGSLMPGGAGTVLMCSATRTRPASARTSAAAPTGALRLESGDGGDRVERPPGDAGPGGECLAPVLAVGSPGGRVIGRSSRVRRRRANAAGGIRPGSRVPGCRPSWRSPGPLRLS